MKRSDVYVDLRGQEIPLGGLDAQDRQLRDRVRRQARTRPNWTEFGNYWTQGGVARFYDACGLSREQSRQTPVYRVYAQDLQWSRLGIAAGLVRPPDYRSELEELIREKFPSRRAFCKESGLSEDMR